MKLDIQYLLIGAKISPDKRDLMPDQPFRDFYPFRVKVKPAGK
jgi:hypothetical protein